MDIERLTTDSSGAEQLAKFLPAGLQKVSFLEGCYDGRYEP